jgi:DNA modification methylase
VWNNNVNAKDVLSFPIISGKTIHPTQKPDAIIHYVLERSSKENDLVLDCFSGSGTTAVACHNLNRRFICIEKDPDYWAASVERLNREKAQMRLF